MTEVPLPASPCLRVRLDYTQIDGLKAGSRLFFQYSGTAPTAANCATFATDVATAWGANMNGLVPAAWGLTEVDVLDIATNSGKFGNWEGNQTGTRSGDSLPANCAMNVEYNIGRRYRGGKPRAFVPAGVMTDLVNQSSWSGGFVSAFEAGWSGLISAIEALTVGGMTGITHVNLSYYKGFTNITNSSGRERAVPTYRDTALLDTITGYSAKVTVGSQRRRRTSTNY